MGRAKCFRQLKKYLDGVFSRKGKERKATLERNFLFLAMILLKRYWIRKIDAFFR